MATPTLAHVRVLRISLLEGSIEGELNAGLYQWTFEWTFREGKLNVHPTRGRALVTEPLKRFLEQQDYALEVGEVYSFILRTKL